MRQRRPRLRERLRNVSSGISVLTWDLFYRAEWVHLYTCGSFQETNKCYAEIPQTEADSQSPAVGFVPLVAPEPSSPSLSCLLKSEGVGWIRFGHQVDVCLGNPFFAQGLEELGQTVGVQRTSRLAEVAG